MAKMELEDLVKGLKEKPDLHLVKSNAAGGVSGAIGNSNLADEDFLCA